ncbi:IclR-like helix-turn-helix domain-containing protein [Nocardia pseudobrasiliensis]|uniref:IclR-like helix-turn-helix domain-containing protein n=1 Tax=Nocardia pseudobrasiliensis TaxID=45979 RepID=A0A370I7Y7_9NOCA|nr:IclR-like helix-turn-helix domain-containing protein [Nocardia pseudobrasiliensis]
MWRLTQQGRDRHAELLQAGLLPNMSKSLTRRAALLAVLTESTTVRTTQDIAKILDEADSSVRRRLHTMQRQGLVTGIRDKTNRTRVIWTPTLQGRILQARVRRLTKKNGAVHR